MPLRLAAKGVSALSKSRKGSAALAKVGKRGSRKGTSKSAQAAVARFQRDLKEATAKEKAAASAKAAREKEITRRVRAAGGSPEEPLKGMKGTEGRLRSVRTGQSTTTTAKPKERPLKPRQQRKAAAQESKRETSTRFGTVPRQRGEKVPSRDTRSMGNVDAQLKAERHAAARKQRRLGPEAAEQRRKKARRENLKWNATTAGTSAALAGIAGKALYETRGRMGVTMEGAAKQDVRADPAAVGSLVGRIESGKITTEKQYQQELRRVAHLPGSTPNSPRIDVQAMARIQRAWKKHKNNQ
jgi:hypothetical protein